MKKKSNFISIIISHPQLLLEWDYEKNIDISPEDVSHGCCYKIWWICDKKHSWSARTRHRANGTKCPQCYGTNLRLTTEFIREFLEKYNQTLLTAKYSTRKEKLHIKCNTCDLEYYKKYQHFKYGKVCPRCEGFSKYTNDDVIKILKKNGDELLNKFINMRTKIKYKCGKCGDISEKVLKSYIDDHKCSTCSNCKRMTFDEVKKYISDKGDKLISNEYNGIKSELIINCHICSQDYKTIFEYYKRGTGCNKCKIPVGERKIMDYLNKNNYSYEFQKGFDKCKNKKKLRFDYEVTIENRKFLIEYDGIQHFTITDFFYGVDGYVARTTNDIIKNRFCIDNKIHLLRICYKDVLNIDTILDNYIKSNKNEILTFSNENIYTNYVNIYKYKN